MIYTGSKTALSPALVTFFAVLFAAVPTSQFQAQAAMARRKNVRLILRNFVQFSLDLWSVLRFRLYQSLDCEIGV